MVDEQNSLKVKMLYYKYIYDKCLIHHDFYFLLKVIVVNRQILNQFENPYFHMMLSIKTKTRKKIQKKDNMRTILVDEQ